MPFRSSEFRGTFRYQFRNARIPSERKITGMALLAEPPANFHSSGMHRIPPESPESGRNLWGTDKTSLFRGWHWSYELRIYVKREPRLRNGGNPKLGFYFVLFTQFLIM